MSTAGSHPRSIRKDARRAQLSERETQALLLRREGADFRNIGRILDCSPSTAYRLVNRGLDKLPQESAEELRHHLLARVDEIYRQHADAIKVPAHAAIMLRSIEVAAKLGGISMEPAGTPVTTIIVDPMWVTPATAVGADYVDADLELNG